MRDGRFVFFCPALSFHLSSCVMVLSPFFELYGWNGLNQRSPAQGAYKAIRVSLNACGRRIAMSTRKLKCQWIKIWEKWIMIYFSCFVYWCFISPSMLKSLRALSPRLKNETRIARMRRILSFHGFFIVFWIWRGFSCAYRRGISPFTMRAEGPKALSPGQHPGV